MAIPPAASIAPCFDPYSPNVVLVLRKSGREAALLDVIENVENLRLLAREQRLNVGGDVASPAEMRRDHRRRRAAHRQPDGGGRLRVVRLKRKSSHNCNCDAMG